MRSFNRCNILSIMILDKYKLKTWCDSNYQIVCHTKCYHEVRLDSIMSSVTDYKINYKIWKISKSEQLI